MWTAQVLPHMDETATDLATLEVGASPAELDAAGAGARLSGQERGGAVELRRSRLTGTVVAAKTDTRAATADVDVDGDGKADATVQLGPVIRGTTLRDVHALHRLHGLHATRSTLPSWRGR